MSDAERPSSEVEVEERTVPAKEKRRRTLPKIPAWARNSLANVTGSVGRRRGSVAKSAFRDVRELYDTRGVRRETFDQAMRRMGLSEWSLVRRRRELLLISRAYYLAAVVMLLASAYFSWTECDLRAWSTLSLASVGLAHAISLAFRVWQIDRRELASFSKFIKHWGSWIG